MAKPNRETGGTLRDALIVAGVVSVPEIPAPTRSDQPQEQSRYTDRSFLPAESGSTRAVQLHHTLDELPAVPKGLRARCRWLLDVHTHCCAGERLYNSFWRDDETDIQKRRTLERLKHKLVRIRSQSMKIMSALDYTPSPTCAVELLRSYKQMRHVFLDSGWRDATEVKKAIIHFLNLHKQELERLSHLDLPVPRGSTHLRASSNGIRQGRVRFVR